MNAEDERVCPLCSGHGQARFVQYSFHIVRCNQCGHEFLLEQPLPNHQATIYGDDYFFGGGAGYSDYLAESKLLTAKGEWYAQLLNKYIRPGTMLDVGAAAGFVLKGFMNHGWKGAGIDPNPTMVQYGVQHLELDLKCGSLESLSELLPTRTFNLICFIQVLPHLYDLRAALSHAYQATLPGGYWLIETWRRDSWTAWCTGRYWHEYSPPSVLHWFTKRGLLRLCESFGMQYVSSGRPKKRIQGEHLRSILTFKAKELPLGKLLEKGLTWIPSNTEFPYPAEDLMWMLVRKPEMEPCPNSRRMLEDGESSQLT